MATWAVVPINPLRQQPFGEEHVVNDTQILHQNLRLLREAQPDIHLLVLSRDPKALTIARQYNALTLRDSHGNELDDSVRRAAHIAITEGASRLLYLAPNTVLLNKDELKHLLYLGSTEWTLALSHCWNGWDIAVAVLNPADGLNVSLAPGSLARVTAEAQRHQFTVNKHISYDLCLDTRQPEEMMQYSHYFGASSALV
jgi:hypothetical protein